MIRVRWYHPLDSRAEIMGMGKAAWLSGHAHLYSEQERAVVMAATSNAIFRVSWHLPAYSDMALAVDDEGGRIIGAIEYRRDRSIHDEYGLVEPMNVDPDYQGRGIGKQMWEYIAGYAKAWGNRGMRVWALNGNQRALGFYANKVGCKIVDRGGEYWLADHVEPATGFQYEF